MNVLPSLRDSLRVLMVEDSEDDAILVLRAIRFLAARITSDRVETPEALEVALREREWDVVISDFRMPAFDGLAALSQVRSHSQGLPFVMISSALDTATMRTALERGANCCLSKKDLSRLGPALLALIRPG